MKNWSSFIILTLVSLFSLVLIIVRALYANQLAFHFLLWNLFLAWLPVLFAVLALRWQTRPILALAAAFLWLLFFPNAPYLVTDLIHLRPYPPVPLWYDLILLLDFALLGLFLGFISLGMMHSLVDNRFGTVTGWVFVLFSLTLGGLGVYIGRFLRWNSWDLFTRPLSLIADVSTQLTEPRTIVVSTLLAMLLIFAYTIFKFGLAAPSNAEAVVNGQ